ncbi:MAG: hypothetical protein ACK2UM_00400 [Anaerolineales bacterium]
MEKLRRDERRKATTGNVHPSEGGDVHPTGRRLAACLEHRIKVIVHHLEIGAGPFHQRLDLLRALHHIYAQSIHAQPGVLHSSPGSLQAHCMLPSFAV